MATKPWTSSPDWNHYPYQKTKPKELVFVPLQGKQKVSSVFPIQYCEDTNIANLLKSEREVKIPPRVPFVSSISPATAAETVETNPLCHGRSSSAFRWYPRGDGT